MTLAIKPGAVLRRGADKLTAAELKVLYDNRPEVDRIIADSYAEKWYVTTR